MKKIITWIGIAVMTLALSLTAFALPSPTVSGFVKGISSAVDSDGTAVDVIVETVSEAETQASFTEAEKKAVEEIKNLSKVKEVMGNRWKDGLQVADIRNVRIVGDASLVRFPVTIRFNVPGVTARSTVHVLHFTAKAGKWEVVDSTHGDSYIQATFNSLSPVAFIVDTDTAEAMESNVTSPKTGQPGFPIWAGAAVVAVLGGAVIFRTNRKGKTLGE